jgi:hypothetical protein
MEKDFGIRILPILRIRFTRSTLHNTNQNNNKNNQGQKRICKLHLMIPQSGVEENFSELPT